MATKFNPEDPDFPSEFTATLEASFELAMDSQITSYSQALSNLTGHRIYSKESDDLGDGIFMRITVYGDNPQG